MGTGASDVAGGADARPTDSAIEHLGDIEKDLKTAKVKFDELMSKVIADFNKQWAGKLKAITAAKVAM